MINTLISLDADLASSIALRYSCRLTEFVDMRLQTIHVEEVEGEGYPPGSGWVRSTWEKGLLQSARQEISQLINAEKQSCPPLGASIVRIGDREQEVLREIEENSYDLLMEGVLNSYNAQLFHKKVRSKLYKYLPCPIILVKNLVPLSRVALLLTEPQDVDPLMATFIKLFGQSKITTDLIYFSGKKSQQEELKTKVTEEGENASDEMAKTVLDTAKAALEKHGLKPKESWVIQAKPAKIGELMEEYSLVGACIPRSSNKKNLIMDALSRVPSATLLCKR